MTINEEIILEGNDEKSMKSHFANCMAHLLKVVVQPERFDASWMRSINDGIEQARSVVNSPSLKKKYENMTMEELKRDAISRANADMKKSNKQVKDNDVTKLINIFNNRVINLNDKEKVTNLIIDQINSLDEPEVFKKQKLSYIR